MHAVRDRAFLSGPVDLWRPEREISVAPIFGALVGSWGHFFAPCVLCLVELAGLSLVILVLIIAGLGILVGRSVGMVSRLGLVKLLLKIS